LPTATCDKGAAAHGGEAMASVVDAWLVDRGGRELLENLGGRRPVRIEVKVRGAPAERRSRWFCRPERAIGVGI